jgi:hypothetical protein
MDSMTKPTSDQGAEQGQLLPQALNHHPLLRHTKAQVYQ